MWGNNPQSGKAFPLKSCYTQMLPVCKGVKKELADVKQKGSFTANKLGWGRGTTTFTLL